MSAETAVPYMNGVARTLEDCLAEFTAALEDEREKAWEAGHAICEAIALDAKAAPETATEADRKASRRALIGAFASAGHCTLNRVVQLSTVYTAFCADGDRRRADKPWTWHRAVRNAAERTETPLVEILKLAEDGGWGQRELDAYGSDVERVTFSGACPECDFDIRITGKKPGIRAAYKGWPLRCPVCEVPTSLGSLS